MSDQPQSIEPVLLQVEPTRVGPIDLLMGVPLVWSLFLMGQCGVGLATGGNITAPAVLVGGLLDGFFTTLIIFIFVCVRHGRRFLDGFRLVWTGPGHFFGALGLGLFCGGIATLLTAHFSTGESAIAELASTPQGLLSISFLAVTLPIVEELYYRGFIFPVVRDLGEKHISKGAGGVLAIGVVSLWFGAVHVPQLWNDFIGIPVVASMGLMWTIMRHRTDSLLPSLVSHLAYNGTLVAVSLATFEW